MDFLAYIDPGSGSAIFQLIIAGSLGAIYYIRHKIYHIFSCMRAKFKKNEKHD